MMVSVDGVDQTESKFPRGVRLTEFQDCEFWGKLDYYGSSIHIIQSETAWMHKKSAPLFVDANWNESFGFEDYSECGRFTVAPTLEQNLSLALEEFYRQTAKKLAEDVGDYLCRMFTSDFNINRDYRIDGNIERQQVRVSFSTSRGMPIEVEVYFPTSNFQIHFPTIAQSAHLSNWNNVRYHLLNLTAQLDPRTPMGNDPWALEPWPYD